MATAEIIANDSSYRDEMVLSRDGYAGTRHFLVRGAATQAEAITADGVPALGAVWDPGLPRLRAARLRVVRDPGRVNFHVRVDYQEDAVAGGGGVTPAENLVVTTQIGVERTSETIYYDLAGVAKLADGGTQKLQVAISFTIRTYHTTLPDLNQLLFLCNEPKVNDAPVVLKNLQGSGQSIQCDAGTMLYVGFEPGKQGDFFYIDHEVQWRATWKHREPAAGQNLAGSGLYNELDIYESANFPAVFS